MSSLVERVLRIMDAKDHWAWPHLTRPGLSRAQLLAHFRHEYHVYVRDFPVLLARTLGLGPPTDVRRALAENIFEEQTGKLSTGVSHPDLFLEMMEGLGFAREALESKTPELEPEAQTYRRFLEDVSVEEPWQLGAAVLTIFVEGSRHERDEVEGKRAEVPIEEAVRRHPLVEHYGCPAEKMRLVRAHRLIEGDHRADAWRMITTHIPEGSEIADEVVARVRRAHSLWLDYRDGVARAMRLPREV